MVYTPRPLITITKEQWITLQQKIRGNTELILTHIAATIGTIENPIYGRSDVYAKYMAYALFTHAIEEYGKLLYVQSIEPNEERQYVIEYDNDRRGRTSSGYFKDHFYKFDLATKDLGNIVKVHNGNFSDDFDSAIFDTDTIANWLSRVNIMNTDIDEDGNPTNITTSIDMNILRQCVFDMKNKVLEFTISE